MLPSPPSMPCPDLCAIILAAGKGKRFGQPKIAALFRGKSFLEHILQSLALAGIDSYHIAKDLPTPDMLSSLRVAVQHVSAMNANGYLVFPVDHPLVHYSTLISLKTAFTQHPDAIIRPSFEGKHGHPIIIPAILDIFGYEPQGGLAEIIRQSSLPMLSIEVTDEYILRNINTLEDLTEHSIPD
ncbi:MAG: NTP transferase domain-containing protein [Candidatus Cloacimonadaceae bacterium]|nr:NTP transferase domain-containing protein [Candidatus Cloacimonadaceae bacterium]